MTEAEKFLIGKNDAGGAATGQISAIGKSDAGAGENGRDVEYSIPARIFGVVLFVVLILAGTYLARLAHKELLGLIVGAAGFGVLRIFWHMRK